MPYKMKRTGSIRIIYRVEDGDTAGAIESACEKALELARTGWGLPPPRDCRVCVMTSWAGFFFRAAPWPYTLPLALLFPAWAGRASAAWRFSAGWTQRFGRSAAIGVKPPRLLKLSDRRIGDSLFAIEQDPAETVRRIVGHELVHACAAPLKLPMWLNEGIAMATVDRLAGRATVKQKSLELLAGIAPGTRPTGYRELERLGREAILSQAARAYWIVRFLEIKLPGFLKGELSSGRGGKAIGERVAAGMGLNEDAFWNEIDGLIMRHFSG